MKRSSILFVLASLVIFPNQALARDSSSEVVVNNLSDWTIEEFYMSSVDDDDWGNDLLGDEVMDPGYALTLTDVSCDDWDILVIDEDEDECVLEDVDLCGDDAVWNITNDELLGCIEDTDQ